MGNFYKKFSDIVRQTGGYASHQTALFFLGQFTEMPEELSIISPRRLTDKVISNRKIKIIFVKDISGKQTEYCKIEDHKIKVSTIEQTLVDLVTAHSKNFSFLVLGKYFLTLNYELDQLIKTASKEGDSFLKRILFYTAWTARASWNDFPKFLRRTPVKLHANLKNNNETLWNSRIYVRYPKEILYKFPNGKLPPLPKEVIKRINLAKYKPFREYFAKLKILPVFDLPEISEYFFGFYREFLQSIKNNPESFLVQIAKPNGEYPEMIIEWVVNQAEKKDLPDWFVTKVIVLIRRNIESKTLKKVIQAVELAIKLRLYKIVLPHLKFINELLSDARQFELIYRICEQAWKNGNLKTQDEILIFLAAMVMASKSTDALELIAEFRKRFAHIPSATNASLSYYAAISLTRIHEFGEAMREIKACRPYFKNPDSNCYQRVGLELTAGHIFQAHGQNTTARNSILNAYRIAKANKIGEPMLLSTLINMTQMEYICGNFLSSIKFANKTLRKIPDKEATTNRYILIKTLLAAYIGIGNLPQSMIYGQKLLKLGKAMGSTPRIAFAELMLAYLYELYGQTAVASQTWQTWDEDCIESKFPFMFPTFIQIKVTKLVLQGDLKEACSLLSKAIGKMSNAKSKLEPKQFLLHHYLLQGILLAKIHHENAHSVFNKAKLISDNLDNCYEKELLLVVTGALFPGIVSGRSLTKSLKFLLSKKAYDPLWFLYASELLQRDIPEGNQYLQAHVEKTHKILLDNLLSRYPYLRKIVPKFLKNEKERTVLLIQSGKSKLKLLKNINKWQPSANVFFVDIANGNWTYQKRNGVIKLSTNTHRILSALLIAKNNSVNLPDLYQTVWGVQFDSEIDKPAVMAALHRCKKALKDISPSISLDWSKQNGSNTEITLKSKIPWAAFL